MKRIVHIFLVAIAAVLLAACSKGDDVRVLRYKLDKIAPTGFRSASVSINLEVSNKGSEISVSDATGTLFADDIAIGTFKIDPVIIKGRQTCWMRVDCALKIDNGVSILEAVKIVRNNSISSFKVSYEATAKRGLLSKTLKEEKVPLSSFVEK